jgi:hypothetical protein
MKLEEVRTYQPAEAARLLALRRDFLSRYLGTPFGELAARNGVRTWQVESGDLFEQMKASASRTPSESVTPPKKTPARPGGGSSGGGGTSSGK